MLKLKIITKLILHISLHLYSNCHEIALISNIDVLHCDCEPSRTSQTCIIVSWLVIKQLMFRNKAVSAHFLSPDRGKRHSLWLLTNCITKLIYDYNNFTVWCLSGMKLFREPNGKLSKYLSHRPYVWFFLMKLDPPYWRLFSLYLGLLHQFLLLFYRGTWQTPRLTRYALLGVWLQTDLKASCAECTLILFRAIWGNNIPETWCVRF